MADISYDRPEQYKLLPYAAITNPNHDIESFILYKRSSRLYRGLTLANALLASSINLCH